MRCAAPKGLEDGQDTTPAASAMVTAQAPGPSSPSCSFSVSALCPPPPPTRGSVPDVVPTAALPHPPGEPPGRRLCLSLPEPLPGGRRGHVLPRSHRHHSRRCRPLALLQGAGVSHPCQPCLRERRCLSPTTTPLLTPAASCIVTTTPPAARHLLHVQLLLVVLLCRLYDIASCIS